MTGVERMAEAHRLQVIATKWHGVGVAVGASSVVGFRFAYDWPWLPAIAAGFVVALVGGFPGSVYDRRARRIAEADKPVGTEELTGDGSALPLDRAGRVALRERLQPITHTQRSIWCSGALTGISDDIGQHTNEPARYRCSDDGTRCLCECHDR